MAWVLAFTALRLAMLSARIASTTPDCVFAIRIDIASEYGSCCILSVGRIALAAQSAARPIRAIDLEHVDAAILQVASQPFSGRSDPMSKLMLTLLAAFCEFERELIRERQREGIAIAKAKGVYKGRKKALPLDQINELVELAHSGLPNADLARSYGISRETVYQYLRRGA